MKWGQYSASLLTLALAFHQPIAAVEGYRYSREIEIISSGWKAIELEGTATHSASLSMFRVGAAETV